MPTVDIPTRAAIKRDLRNVAHRNIDQDPVASNLPRALYRTKQLGEGGFGRVHQVRARNTGTLYALKTVKFPPREAHWTNEVFLDICAEHQEDFLIEARTMSRIRHPYIMQLAGDGLIVSTDKTTFPLVGILMEAMRGSVCDLLIPADEGYATPKGDTYQFALLSQMASAFTYLHSALGLIHRDVKPENIFFSRVSPSRGYAFKLGDLGQAAPQQRANVGLTGTPVTNAPEQAKGYPRPVSDVYSLFMTVALCLDRDDFGLWYISDRDHSSAVLHQYMKKAQADPRLEAFRRMGNRSPHHRPSAAQILKETLKWRNFGIPK